MKQFSFLKATAVAAFLMNVPAYAVPFIRTGTYIETVTFGMPVTVRSYDGSAIIGKP